MTARVHLDRKKQDQYITLSVTSDMQMTPPLW